LMDIGAIFLILALVVLVSVFITRPFFEVRPVQYPGSEIRVVDEEEHQRSRLLAEYDQILTSIQELDFDYALNKIPQDAYPFQRSNLLQDAAILLSRLDVLQQESSQASIEDRIETAIKNRRPEATVSTHQNVSADLLTPETQGTTEIGQDDIALETMIALRRGKNKVHISGFCPQCGRPVQKDENYCPKCGTSLVSYEKN
jgi:hypothetical protein